MLRSYLGVVVSSLGNEDCQREDAEDADEDEDAEDADEDEDEDEDEEDADEDEDERVERLLAGRQIEAGPCGIGYIVTQPDGTSEYRQADWDWPGLAEDFGWCVASVRGKKQAVSCEHEGTDGTVRCDHCGTEVHEFLDAAANYLDSLC